MSGLFDVAGRTVLVTGGGRGIGRMIADGFAAAGAEVHVVSRLLDVEELRAAGLRPWVADLSTEAGCAEFASEFAGATGRLDVLVNNAGATWGAPLEEFDSAAWDKVVDLNLKSPFFLVRELAPLLGASATPNAPSRIVNIGSIDGLRVPTLSTYSYTASKAALHHLTRVLAVELGPRNITVNAIAPGPFESKMMAAVLAESRDEFEGAAPLGRIGRPDDAAALAILLAAPGGSFLTGTVIPLDGGLSIVSPR
ncbi:SDR family oxidoreductase [Aeromicrobium tamlense]|uniref:NAD(P)-dependent dehydrogenase (Short-subunit alcohol dehydrogenase family) n=1 Tax=Aeromicrobium tamlense TaxID=375541 RepID=A0A8I0FTS9_9ACTN|nr:SDR family oxidoreductase [Aeromicrobium tamlense]MBD1269473.1 SDR family oxidoreductase [Aeromicrobium tamlense]NYI39873.1 NAD(P)-dependent dehydrogenase (short-subunit alcohol dehydrogenase family) [Aeromicrobium tamlense]